MPPGGWAVLLLPRRGAKAARREAGAEVDFRGVAASPAGAEAVEVADLGDSYRSKLCFSDEFLLPREKDRICSSRSKEPGTRIQKYSCHRRFLILTPDSRILNLEKKHQNS